MATHPCLVGDKTKLQFQLAASFTDNVGVIPSCSVSASVVNATVAYHNAALGLVSETIKFTSNDANYRLAVEALDLSCAD